MADKLENLTLSEGALHAIMTGGTVDRPVMQIVDWNTADKKEFDQSVARRERWPFLLNDGRHTFSRVMLSSECPLKKLPPFSVITIERYDCPTRERKTANGQVRKGLMIYEASIKVPGGRTRKLIGNPTPLEDELDDEDSEPAFKIEFGKSDIKLITNKSKQKDPPLFDHFLCTHAATVTGGELTAGTIYRKVETSLQLEETPARDPAGPRAEFDEDIQVVSMEDTVVPPQILTVDKNLIARHLYGPLSAIKLEALSSNPSKEWRIESYFHCLSVHRFNELKQGDHITFRRNDEIRCGILRWKSPLPENPKWRDVQVDQLTVGLQLSSEFNGHGNSDGKFEGKRYFNCRKNCAVFVPFECVLHEEGDCPSASITESDSANLANGDLSKVLSEILHLVKKTGDKSGSKRKKLPKKDPLGTSSIVPHHNTIGVKMPKMLIDDYGRDKHLQNIEKAKKVPGLIRFHHDANSDSDVLTFDCTCDESIVRDTLRQHLDVEKTLVKLQPQQVERFRRAGSLSAVNDISRCTVYLDEKAGGLVLVGLPSERNAAELILHEHITGLNGSQHQKKVKSKKNIKKVASSNCEDQLPTSNRPKLSTDCNESGHAPSHADLRSKIVVGNNAVVHPNTLMLPEEEMEKTVVQRSELDAAEILDPLQIVPDGNIADCLVCLAEPPTIAFIPCGHRHTCANCAKKIFESNQRCCPTCREQIQHCYRIWT